MADNQTQSREEIERQRAEARETALKTFKVNGKMLDLAVAFYVENDKGYGEKDNAAVDDYIFDAAVGSDEYKRLMKASRQGGKRYTGSEYGVIQTAAKIVQESLGSLNIGDIYGLMGSKVELSERFKEGYLVDYAKSENKEAREFAKTLSGAYIADLMDKKVAEALASRRKARVSQLEEMVKEPEAQGKAA